uniref:E3 ubiquitin-protein ligase n=1 Tax=Sinocyclocheilus anshuiensis TaxID=1608454 RepID=A0A671MP42_9TELE
VSPQSRFSLDMDTKDLPTQLEMDKVHWDLMNLSYKEQLSQLETKYGVSFHEDKVQKNVINVQARSKGVQHINLESHALRALTQLYQKLKTLQRNVFDDQMKKSIDYSGDIPHTKGINWNQTPDYGPGAVGGAVQDEGVKFRGQGKADASFNEDSKDNSRHVSKGAHAEEETCTICMDSFTNKKKLKCGHEFCQECIRMSVESLGSICPVCKEVFGKLEGNQPDGRMKVTKNRLNLPGYPHCGTIEIYYDIPNGIQTVRICKTEL